MVTDVHIAAMLRRRDMISINKKKSTIVIKNKKEGIYAALKQK